MVAAKNIWIRENTCSIKIIYFNKLAERNESAPLQKAQQARIVNNVQQQNVEYGFSLKEPQEGTMKKQLLKSALIAVAGIGLLAGSAMALPTDPITTSDYFTLTDNSTFSVPVITFTNLTNLGNFLGAGNVFGIYTDSSTLFPILTSTSALSVYVFFKEINGTWYVDTDQIVTDTDTAFGDVFGFYYTDGSDTYFTDASLNTPNNEFIEMRYKNEIATATFEYGANMIQIAVETHDVSPVPEPATMLLFGTGIAGLAGIARRKKVNE